MDLPRGATQQAEFFWRLRRYRVTVWSNGNFSYAQWNGEMWWYRNPSAAIRKAAQKALDAQKEGK